MLRGFSLNNTRMKRVFLFILTNLAVMAVLSVAVHLLGLNRWMGAHGINYSQLLIMCGLFGFGGAGISLLLSKPMAKWSTGARTLSGNEGGVEAWLVATVDELARKAGIATPEVAIYDGAPNAFATGAFRNSALVAVSTGLMQSMDRSQVRAVLAHEVAHVANGDMQTMGLLQGVMNTFVMFVARVVGTVVDKAVLRNTDERSGIGYMVTVFVLEMVFGLLASLVVMAFSRHREYRADWMAAQLLGSAAPMQSALHVLGRMSGEPDLPKQVAAFGITGGGLASLLRSHPPISKRIAALAAFRG